jgi:hypothetical protein
MAVLDEMQLADAVDVDRGHRLAPPACRSDPLPPALQPVRARAKQPVELAVAAVDGADDRFEADHLQPQVALSDPAQRRHDHIEEQHRQRVRTSRRQTRGELRD